ncbi:glycoside hydrolase [Ramicandelaber brevisporus]|nr:glycoside hydrolase [Ramicandelaber brevisporus]
MRLLRLSSLLSASTFLLGTLFPLPSRGAYDPKGQRNLVLYYGTDSYANTHGMPLSEKPLSYYCDSGLVDVFVLSFLHIVRPIGQWPAMEIKRCDQFFDGTDLINCPQMGKDIQYCQKKGIKVLLSIGGGAGYYYLLSEAHANDFAYMVWNMFLGGTDKNYLRPFGKDTVLDGIDLDLEAVSGEYPAFVKELRRLYNGGAGSGVSPRTGRVSRSGISSSGDDEGLILGGLGAAFPGRPPPVGPSGSSGGGGSGHGSPRFMLTAAPQCPFPDMVMDKTLNAAPFDYVAPQFYNNFCECNKYKTDQFTYELWDEWARKAAKAHPDIPTQVIVGIPASTTAAGSGYLSPSMLKNVIGQVRVDYPETFGGIMMWDTSQAFNNTNIGGVLQRDSASSNYASLVRTFLQDTSSDPPPSPQKPGIQPPTTPPTSPAPAPAPGNGSADEFPFCTHGYRECLTGTNTTSSSTSVDVATYSDMYRVCLFGAWTILGCPGSQMCSPDAASTGSNIFCM